MQSPDVQRLSHIFDYCKEIEKTVQRYGSSFEIFDKDADYQRSVAFCLLQIGELSGGLSAEYRAATANRMPWAAIKGMRNFVAHNYGNMSRKTVWETVTHDIPLLRDFCRQQLEIDWE